MLSCEQEAERAAAQAAAQQAVHKQLTLNVMRKGADRALIWGLLSVLMCLPVFPNVLSFLGFLRAQRAARELGAEVPTRAKVGVALALLIGLASLAFWIWVIIGVRAQDAQLEARKVVLTQQIAQHASVATLDQPFACALAELFILNNGFAGITSVASFHGFECLGAVHIVKERAELGDFKLATSSNAEPVTATICFKHGERWFVERTGVVSCELK
jgi:hypothetical protein